MFPTTSAVSFWYSCFLDTNFVHVYILNAGYLLSADILYFVGQYVKVSYVAVTTDLYFRHLTENPIPKPTDC